MTSSDPRQIYATAAALHRADRLDEAERLYRQVLEADPRHADARHRLGVIEQQRGRPAAAVELIRSAIALSGGSAGAHYNLALALYDLDRLEEAAEACRAALRAKPDFLPALYTLGLSLKDLGRLDQAIAAYAAVTARDPDFAEAHYGESFARLLAGDFAGGWPKYEWRRRVFPQRAAYSAPQWRGEAIAGKTLLIHAEQGLGDTIQFARYVKPAAEKGARIVFEVQPALLKLFSGFPGVETLICFGDPVPPHDLQCPLLSLPALFETIPAASCLSAEPIASAQRIGVAWRGNPQHSEDRRRSLSAAQMAACFAGTGLNPVCLQKDATPEELAAFTPVELSDFGMTASVIAGLDLVVTVDTVVAHLAGALGKPVWTLLGFAPDWRWQQKREDSPWYPSMRLFRQQEPGDWNPVIDKVREGICRIRN